MQQKLLDIAGRFALEGEIRKIESLGQGFINDTFIIRSSEGAPDYILQRKNHAIFPDVPAMMDNILKVTAHIRKQVVAQGGDPLREVMTIVLTKEEGKPYVIVDGEYWTVSVFIADTIAYDRADTPELARKGGEGIGKFQAQLADFTEPLHETIPGFHDMAFRFKQWDEVLAADPVGRKAQLEQEIGWIESRRQEMLEFRKLIGPVLPVRVTHNDTKINNVLFDKQGNVLCVIDLDTVMNASPLNDYGDAIRTYTNTGAEDDRDLKKVGMSMEMFEAYTDGYLSQQAAKLCQAEIDYLAFGARYIVFEQVLRFLMDYIDGDRYYRIASPDHNLIRTHAQYALLQSIEAQYDAMCEVVRKIAAKYRQ